MISITLKNGDVKKYDQDLVTGYDIANSIGSGSLAKQAFAMYVDDKLTDIQSTVQDGATVNFLTNKNSAEFLEVLRHSTAHIMAQAVQKLFPDVQITIGPVVENGFYYDFDCNNELSEKDFARIEECMREIVDQDYPIVKQIFNRKDAIELFKSYKQEYKVEIINSIEQDQDISIYEQGGWQDLCRGPHLPSTGWIGYSFKIMRLTGAYWRGDSNNNMLQRLYGTAWQNNKKLEQYLYMLEEAAKRDHRALGKQLHLFHFQEEAMGCVFWHEKGWQIYLLLQNYIRDQLRQSNYIEVNTPQVVHSALWKKSGHWAKFYDNMLVANYDGEDMVIKPMNCPCHAEIFKNDIKSYRDLPIRMAEFGSCYRREYSGALHGLMRLRAFTQDDAHIFCTEDHIVTETKSFCELLKKVYKNLGFVDIKIKFSDRPVNYAGSLEIWDKAEHSLLDSIKASGLEWEENKGEGAFYGPKIEFVLTDAIGREWQCGTLQVDFVLPRNLDIMYVDSDGSKKHVVLLHRAILGSLERFIGILTEHYAGVFPFWLAPVQVAIVSVVNDDNVIRYTNDIADNLRNNQLRIIVDITNNQINYKIREYSQQKIPIIVIIGNKEVDNNNIAVRYFGKKSYYILSFDELIAHTKKMKVMNGG